MVRSINLEPIFQQDSKLFNYFENFILHNGQKYNNNDNNIQHLYSAFFQRIQSAEYSGFKFHSQQVLLEVVKNVSFEKKKISTGPKIWI